MVAAAAESTASYHRTGMKPQSSLCYLAFTAKLFDEPEKSQAYRFSKPLDYIQTDPHLMAYMATCSDTPVAEP